MQSIDQDAEITLPCVEKMAFDSKTEAEGAATAAEWQHGGALKVYKCRHCNLWHLASA